VSPAPIDIPGLTIFGDHNACESSPDYGFYPFAVDCYAKAGATELPLIVAGQIDGRRYVCRDYRLSIQSNSGAPASVTTNSALPYHTMRPTLPPESARPSPGSGAPSTTSTSRHPTPERLTP